MHRRKDLFGEDAEEFRPQRWDEETLPYGWVRIVVFFLLRASYTSLLA